MPLVISQHLLNAFVQLATKRGLKKYLCSLQIKGDSRKKNLRWLLLGYGLGN
jgi:hypothetical protein